MLALCARNVSEPLRCRFWLNLFFLQILSTHVYPPHSSPRKLFYHRQGLKSKTARAVIEIELKQTSFITVSKPFCFSFISVLRTMFKVVPIPVSGQLDPTVACRACGYPPSRRTPVGNAEVGVVGESRTRYPLISECATDAPPIHASNRRGIGVGIPPPLIKFETLMR